MTSPISQVQRVTILSERSVGPIRQQLALTRALLDQVDTLVPSSPIERVPRAQFVEELTSLACRVLEAAASLVDAGDDLDSEREPVSLPLARCRAPARARMDLRR